MEDICVCLLFYLVYVEDTDVGFYGLWAGDGQQQNRVSLR